MYFCIATRAGMAVASKGDASVKSVQKGVAARRAETTVAFAGHEDRQTWQVNDGFLHELQTLPLTCLCICLDCNNSMYCYCADDDCNSSSRLADTTQIAEAL